MTLYIILAALWFLSGALCIVIFVLFVAKDDYKASDILPTILGGMLGLGAWLILLSVTVETAIKADKILIKRRK